MEESRMNIDISVITFTLGGRNKYLIECVNSVANDIFFNYQAKINIEHHIIFQGVNPNISVLQEISIIEGYHKNQQMYKATIHKWPENIGIGAGLNKILPECKGELIFKMDDDCKIISERFFEQAFNLYKRFPNSVFSPFPVGLIRAVGGTPARFHKIWWDKNNDIVYTKRIVSHVGGFARFAPKAIVEKFTFPNDKIAGISGTEDGEFSSYCNASGVEMFYLENGLVVEHAESTLGQILRYPKYFEGRNYEGNVKLIVED